MKAKLLVLVGILALLSGCGSRESSEVSLKPVAEVSYSIDGAKLVINTNLIFEADRKTLKPEAVSVLRRLFQQIDQEYYTNIKIYAHCEDILTEAFAREITDFQAQVVGGYLWFKGVSAVEIEAEGKGYSEPIGDMRTPMGVYTNQRIEILLT